MRSMLPVAFVCVCACRLACAGEFRVGISIEDVTPARLPVIIAGGFLEQRADKINDRLYARTLVLDDGAGPLGITVIDSCLCPRELLDAAKELARAATGIAPARMLIAATHTHSAPAAMGCLGTDADAEYVRTLPALLARGIESAARNLAPARAGWAVVRDFERTHCRRWILRPDKIRTDPFGGATVRAHMHPGYQHPDFVGPAGPVDPDLSVLAVRTLDGRPRALFANYSMHYFGAAPVSADYYGRFVAKVGALLGAEDPGFLAVMSQGTSGDLHWMDYSRPERAVGIDAYAEGLAREAVDAFRAIECREAPALAMAEETLVLARRVPDEGRLAWARKLAAEFAGRAPQTIPEVYAREQLLLAAEPRRELKLQALRIGDLGIVALPCEVFGITALRIKAQSPCAHTVVMELANGEEGYIPPPAQHALGGYTTWPARTAGLEVAAEPKLAEVALALLERVAGAPRRPIVRRDGPYAEAIAALGPRAYFRFEEFEGPLAADASGNGVRAEYEGGIAFYLDGPASARFSGEAARNRAVHLAGGCVRVAAPGLGDDYTLVLWFWNGLPSSARPVTAYLCGRGGERVGIGGAGGAQGRLFFARAGSAPSFGATELALRSWHFLALVRTGSRASVFLDGAPVPEVECAAGPAGAPAIVLGGCADGDATLEGKLDEAALFGRALAPAELQALFAQAGALAPE